MTLRGMPLASTSTEGYCFDSATGVTTAGLLTEAVKPSSVQVDTSYDAIVIGAGFCGLVAARDLSLKCKKVLLLEARDRIGGRTWAVRAHDHVYELGGTWIHWLQPHVWSEITRYNLTGAIKESNGMTKESVISYPNDTADDFVVQDPEETDKRLLPLIAKFVDCDGEGGRSLFPNPYRPLDSIHVWRKWDLSLRERTEQIDMTPKDREFLLLFFNINCMVLPAVGGYLNFMRLFSLSNYDYNCFMAQSGKYKFADGTSHLASCILSEFRGTVLLDEPVKSVVTTADKVKVETRGGKVFDAAQIICTIPLHCLSDVRFDPALPEAFSSLRHPNQGGKVHVRVQETMQDWFGMGSEKASVVAAMTESMNPQGGTHLVTFAMSDGIIAQHHLRENPRAYLELLQKDVLPTDFKATPTHMVWHDWARDEFAKGAWASYGAGVLSDSLGSIMQNTKVSPRVVMANADWANGWVGYIDGAIEMGRKYAHEISSRLEESYLSKL
ncbi:hypothetical protein FAUST_4218 [Fusarium austroamericanum]|uniref:Amine oxidase n=1 Tax=Fusarium austroamericanum TaxID=282268 RepID=A0AAN6C3E9_FUSAU|nr:hypothetical protein FAUST_4218 [Fusarium austroamericanum]